jgi:DNA repair exonuclease SbcCD ATPase subunit
LRQKIGLLLKQWQAVRRENERLQKENALLREQERAYQETIAHLDHQVEAFQATDPGPLDEVDKKALERKISGYIKEIDRCIALLTE